jgi:hypothetical protein
MINSFLDGSWTYDQFAETYYWFYLDKVPEGVLTVYDHDFFGMAQEKLDWTTEAPDTIERHYGWMDREEYRDWLRQNLKEYLIALPEDP